MVVPNSGADPRDDNRLLAGRLLWLQAGMGLAAALAGWAFWGRNAGISVLAGAFIGVVANLYMTLRGLRPASTARGALGRLYFGQLVKMVVGVALLIVAVKYVPHVSVPALLMGFIATLVVVWFVSFASVARVRRDNGGSGAG